MRSDRRFLAPLLGLGLLTIAGAPASAIIAYATRSAWESAVGTFDTEDFETTPLQGENCSERTEDGNCTHEVVFSTPKLQIVLPPGSDGHHRIQENGSISVNGSREFLADLHGRILILGISHNTIVFPDPITAFAVDLANVFDPFNEFCTLPQPGPPCEFPLTIALAGEDAAVAAGSTFFGATSETPFTSVTVRITDPNFNYGVLPVLDDISFAVVPEPDVALLVALGLVVLSTRRRRAS